LKRLVIKHGDQILRHELGSGSVTVGRDPSCELSFDDASLSRRHASFLATATGVRFVDLGSRNGSWVNSKKTKEADLSPGDAIRIGALLITYSYDPPAAPPPAPVAPTADDDIGDDTATVFAAVPAAAAPADKTVLLNRGEKAQPPPPDGGTVLIRPEKPAPKVPTDTARLTPDKVAPRPLPAPAPMPTPIAPVVGRAPGVGLDPEAPPPPARWSWTAKHAFITLGVGLVLYLVLAFPLVRTLGNALREESLRRGRALLDSLASSNGAAVAEGRARDLDVDKVTREERVKEALLLDLQGKVLAPSSRVEEALTRIEGIEPATEEIRTFYLGRRGSDYVMVEPILDRGKRVGIAVLVYEVATSSGSWAVAVMFLGFLVLLLGALVAMILGKRFTIEPIAALGDDIEAVVKGDAPRIPLAQGFSELTELAKSINRLIDRSPALAAPHSGAALRIPSIPSPARPAPSSPSAPSIPGPLPTRARGPAATPVPLPVGAPATASPASGSVDGARFWVDPSFLVVRVEPEAASLLGSTPETMEGHHVIEAIKDQKVLGIVLDSLNALESGGASGPPPTAELASGAVSVTAAREGDWVVVSLKPAG
jgi:FHA domain